MKQKIVILTSAIISLLFSSCIFSPSINGNGNVAQENRTTEAFDEIKVSRGMNVYISLGNETKVVVRADENLLDIIETEVIGNVLKVSTDANIRKAKEKKVFITTPNLKVVEAFAGSNVFSENTLETDELEVSASAGANIKLEINSGSTTTTASAGSNIKLEGKSESLYAKASSGSNIKAENLKTNKCTAKVSSGANIWVSAKNNFKGNASSGGNIFYYGNPSNTDINRSSGGNVIKNAD